MTASRRLKVCYAVPGSDLVSSMGPTRNVLNLARALGQFADVTVAFRRVADETWPEGVKILEIEPAAASVRADMIPNAFIGVSGIVAEKTGAAIPVPPTVPGPVTIPPVQAPLVESSVGEEPSEKGQGV